MEFQLQLLSRRGAKAERLSEMIAFFGYTTLVKSILREILLKKAVFVI
jgi:hypothetical protein